MVTTTAFNYAIVFMSLTGLGLSIYAYVVELAIAQNENYVAMCDISERMSCTKAFKSPFGKGFGFISQLLGEDSFLNQPNPVFGILFYSLFATLALSNSKFITQVSLFLAFLANLSSIYFAYILYFVLYNLCVVCVSTYVVNIINLSLVYFKLKSLKKGAEAASRTSSAQKLKKK